jgi:ADP-ribosylglycohydrolase/Carbohydrate esterase 2 N-terminal
MTTRAMVVSLAAVLAGGAARAPDTAPPARRLSRRVLEDKIRGGWAGQMIGVSFGAPTEFRFKGRTIEGPIAWKPENVANAIDQDDLYVEMTFAEVMDRLGLEATTEQYGEMFKDSKYDLWHANAGARRLLNHGIKAPWSGHPKYNAHANDIDFQIESDFIGLMTPGLPQEANKYANRVGRVMNYGDGLYGGMFFGGMYAAAFFENDPRRVVEAGLRSIPAESGYAKVIRDVLAWSARHPEDWKKTWQLVTDKWDRDDACPDGALDSFNIDARLNGAFVALGLLYGTGDFTRTLDVSTRAGQDSDCNPSSAAGILGVMLGYGRIPPGWKAGIPAIATTKFRFTSYSFDEITRSTMNRAFKVIEGAGGRVTPTEVVIPLQPPKAPALEQWSVDPPTARIASGDPAWTWSEGWRDAKDNDRSSGPTMKAADKSGAEATLKFRGTGLSVAGRCSQEGGRADVYLDGEKVGEIDAYVVPRTHDDDYWHVTALTRGEHTLRIVTRADKDERSTGTQIGIERAVVYGN